MTIIDFLQTVWDCPPQEMSLEPPFAVLLDRCGTIMQTMRNELRLNEKNRDKEKLSLLARELYVLLLGIIN